MAKDSRIWLKNWNKIKTEVFSSDGNSIQLMPESKTLTESKFLWNLPKGVEEYRENYTVFGKKTKEVNVTKKTGNLETAEADRTTLDSDNKPAPSNPNKSL
jgi:hypothetical protein